MIRLNNQSVIPYAVEFYLEEDEKLKELSKNVLNVFQGKFLETCYMPVQKDKAVLLTGLGKKEELNQNKVKEAFAKAAKTMKNYGILEFSMNLSYIIELFGIEILSAVVEGIMLGFYEFNSYKMEKEEKEYSVELNGILESDKNKAELILKESMNVMEGVIFARNAVNTPGNKLRPMDFAREIIKIFEDTKVETELLVFGQLKALEMNALAGVGSSSEYPPCFLIIKYLADSDSEEITGLVGKGVTCDTGGYCLKPSNSMMGIKGDMAGGAAVTGAIYALAKNNIKTNVIGFIPMCENRISPGSLLPGDVITSFSGKTIEICNTDAEGRLILADAVTYAVQKEKVTRILDIATLTGAVVNMLGFSTAGVVTDNQEFWEQFRKAYKKSGERYWRLPIFNEHEKMIESKIADVKNMGESFCGTITAGLFIRKFAEGRPWMHLDIAGTAWMDKPVFEYQSKGATGAGVTSIYYLLKK